MSSPDALPFLLVYGAWLWKASLVVLVALAAGTWWALWRYLPRAVARPPAAADDVEELAGALVLEDGDAVSSLDVKTAGARYRDATYDLRPSEVQLRCDDGRTFALMGELRVVLGSGAAVGRGCVPRALPDDELARWRSSAPWLHRFSPWRSDVHTATLRTLKDGDRVLARGVIERGPSGGETDFRTAEVAWSMRGGAGPLQLIARHPAAERRRPSVLVVAVGLAACAFAGYQMEKGLGESWSARCASELSPHLSSSGGPRTDTEPFPFEDSHACLRAAMVPGDRDYALERLSLAIAAHPHRSEQVLQRLDAIDRLRGACSAITSRYLELQRFDDAVAAARRCAQDGSSSERNAARRDEREALVSLALFEEAAALQASHPNGTTAYASVPTLIAADRWFEAAQQLEAEADQFRALIRNEENKESIELTILHRHCLALLARHWGGDASAAASLRARRAQPYGASCAPMLAALEGPSAANLKLADGEPQLSSTATHLDALGLTVELPRAARPTDESEEARLRRRIEKQLSRRGVPEELLGLLDAVSQKPPWELWLSAERIISARIPSRITPALTLSELANPALTPPEPAPTAGDLDAEDDALLLLRWQAARAVLLGDLDGARAKARQALARAISAEAQTGAPADVACLSSRCAVRHLLPILELFTSTTEQAAPVAPQGAVGERGEYRFAYLYLRLGMAPPPTRFRPGERLEPLLLEAQRGDGRPLAAYLRGPERMKRWSDADLIAVLPRIDAGRAELREALRWEQPSRLRVPSTLAEAAVRALARRTVMQLAGNAAQAKMWDEIAKRLDDVLSNRRRLLALMFYEL